MNEMIYAEWQDAYRRDFKPNGAPIEFREGLPQMADYSSDNEKRKLLILDDLMRESSSDVILDLFTKDSRHKNISVIFVTQNVFHKGKAQRDISLNIKYLVSIKNPCDRAQIHHLARLIFPEDSAFLREAYLDATREPHSYLFIDLSQAYLDELFRAKIFPNDGDHVAYVPKYLKSSWMKRELISREKTMAPIARKAAPVVNISQKETLLS